MPRASVSSPPASAVTMILTGFLGKLLGPAARVSPGAARVSAPPRAVPRNLRLTSPCVTTAASVLGAGIMPHARRDPVSPREEKTDGPGLSLRDQDRTLR